MEYLSNFENYLHFEEKDRVVQTAIMHAQFEIINPVVPLCKKDTPSSDVLYQRVL